MKTFTEWLQENEKNMLEVAGYSIQEWDDVVMNTLDNMKGMVNIGDQAQVIYYFIKKSPEMRAKLKAVTNDVIESMKGDEVARLSDSEKSQIAFTRNVINKLILGDEDVSKEFNNLFLQFKTGEKLGKLKTFGQRFADKVGDISGKVLGRMRKAGDATAAGLDKGVDTAVAGIKSIGTGYKKTMDFMNNFGLAIDDALTSADTKAHEIEGNLKAGARNVFAGAIHGMGGSPENRNKKPVPSYVRS